MLAFLLVACKKEHTFYGHLYDAPAYDFELTSQEGKRVKLSDYLREKKIVLLFFGYTFCPDVCPTALTTMAEVMKNLNEKERERVQVLFISVDPREGHSSTVEKLCALFLSHLCGSDGKSQRDRKNRKGV
jgi:protein SCO1/2